MLRCPSGCEGGEQEMHRDLSLGAARSSLVVACALCLGGSIWAAAFPPACPMCGQAAELLGGISLAPLGVIFYSALLLMIALNAPSRQVCWAIVGAVGVHTVLLTLLFLARIACAPCILTAVGAGLMLLSLHTIDRRLFWRGAALAAAFALPVVITVRVMDAGALAGGMDPEVSDRALFAAGALVQLDPPARKPVRIAVYWREGCPSCRKFRADVLPAITAEFARRVDIQYWPAWETLPTPAVVVTGANDTVFRVVPSVVQKRQAVLHALR